MVDRYDEELFLEYVEGELPVEKRIAFENQMLQDPRLRNLVAQMVLDRHRMRTLPDETPPDHLMDAVHERLERAMLLGASPQEFTQSKPLANKGFRWRRFATMGAMAAMVAVVAGVFVVTLVQLANDTPIRKVGPGSLFPPGMLPPSLVPTKPNIANSSPSTDAADPADATNATAGQQDGASTASAGTSAGTTADATSKQPTPPDLALAPSTLPGVKPGLTTPALLQPSADGGKAANPPLPAASLVFSVTTRDIPAASQRLNSWIIAYQAKQLDSRAFEIAAQNVNQADKAPVESPGASFGASSGASMDVTGSIDTALDAVKAEPVLPLDAAPTANQAITLDSDTPPTPLAPVPAQTVLPQPQAQPQPASKATAAGAQSQSGLMVTLALPDEQVLPLEMFLTTLPDAQVRRAVVETPPHTAQSAAPLPYVLADRVDAQPSQSAASATEAAASTNDQAAQQWLGRILPDWLLHPSATSPTSLPENTPPPTPAGHTIVRVEFIPG